MSATARENEAASAPEPPPASSGGLPSQIEGEATTAEFGKDQLVRKFGNFVQGYGQIAKTRQAAKTGLSESQLGYDTGHAASAASFPLPIRPKGGDGRGSTGRDDISDASNRNPIQGPGQGFKKSSEARDTRKAPPKALDMAHLRPNSFVGPDERPTHYLAVPISSPISDFNERQRLSLEQRLTAMNPTGSRVILAKSPRAVLRPEDIRSPVDQHQIKEVPEDERHLETALEKCSLATPMTAQFAPERLELKRDAERAGVVCGLSKSDGEDERSAPSSKRVARVSRVPGQGSKLVARQKSFRLISRLSAEPKPVVHLCKYLRAADILTLYSVSYDFYRAVQQWMRGSIRTWAELNVPSARWVFDWRLPEYQHLANEAPAPWHSALSPTVRKFLEEMEEPEATNEVANLETYLESRGIDISDRKGQEVTNKATKEDGAGHASKSTVAPKSQYQRVLPTLKWYLMVYSREHTVRDILALLAREGHRVPPGTAVSLLKLWKLMDLPTTAQRQYLLAERPDDFDAGGHAQAGNASDAMSQSKQGFTDLDLLRIQCFFTKLDLLFNDPSSGLLELIMGQKGLKPLRQMLFGERYRTAEDLVLLKMRYDAGCTWFPCLPLPLDELVRENYTLVDMPAEKMGKTHMEHWGAHYDAADTSTMGHLLRPTCLIAQEAARRRLSLEDPAMPLRLWGDVDQQSGSSLYPSLSEMYMEDAEYKLRLLDTSHHFGQFEALPEKGVARNANVMSPGSEPSAKDDVGGSHSSAISVDLETTANEGPNEHSGPRRPVFQYPKSPARLSVWKQADPSPAQNRARTVGEVKRDCICANSGIFDKESPMYLGQADPAAAANVPNTIDYQDEWEDAEWESETPSRLRQGWLRGDDDGSGDDASS